MTYREWETQVPEAMKKDSVWKMEAYRLAVFVGDIGWSDVTKLFADRRTIGVSEQLYEALGSMSANLTEGYSRGSNKDRARFYEYSLGSARENKDWYYKGRHILGIAVMEHRMKLLNQIIWLLLTMIPDQRGRTLREKRALYLADPVTGEEIIPLTPTELDELLNNIPSA